MKKYCIWILIIILFLIFLLLLIDNDKKVEEIIIDSKDLSNNTFEIIDNSLNCNETLEEIYNDEDNIYYLECSKSKFIRIKYANGDEFSLNEILKNKKISIEKLIEKGLKVIIKEKNNNSDTNDDNDMNDTNNTNGNSDMNDKNNDVILTIEEINSYNKKIASKTDMIYSLEISKITKEQVLNYITKYNLPTLPKYDDDLELNQENTQDILNNRNLEGIKEDINITKGIIVKRANLRSFPSNIHFYDKQYIKDFDRLQETELLVNTPVLIVHESLDKLWYFVISPFYVGWVLKENVGLASDDMYNYFINNNNFIVITKDILNINDTILDMSVKLPYVNQNGDNIKAIIPIKDDNGIVIKKEVLINKNDINIGYLPYTKDNVLKQANKYLGVNYSWGGMDYGVDCSSFVANLYRTFGFLFPRNTSTQSKSVGNITDLSNKSANEKLQIINGTNPSLLYQNGHVMLYIGKENNKHYIIHASGSLGKVVKSELTLNSSYIRVINKLITIK